MIITRATGLWKQDKKSEGDCVVEGKTAKRRDGREICLQKKKKKKKERTAKILVKS